MKLTYYIDHIAAGSINLGNRSRIKVNGSYQEAVDMAHKVWCALENKTLVTVHTDEHCLYYWHWIGAKGEVKDRNINSGVVYPAGYSVVFKDNAYRLAA